MNMREDASPTPTLEELAPSSWRETWALRRLERVLRESPVAFEVRLSDGGAIPFGSGEPRFRLVLRTPEALSRIASLDEGRIADAYMEGLFDVEGEILEMYELRRLLADRHPLAYLWRFVQPLVFGQAGTNARAIENHYDLDPSFYCAFMGESRCYTQGIFAHPEEPLEEAIRRKFDFAIDAAQLREGSRVLEVGPGWGAFAEHAAKRGIRLTGVTNSKVSEDFMRDLGRRLGADWRIVNEDILEYAPNERYDAIVLMGIMEHLPDYPRILRKFTELLVPGGRVYLDASATREKFEASSFTYRHIYRGNHSFFVLHDFLEAVAGTPFRLRGVHDDQENYFLTFRAWARQFESHRDEIVRRFGEWEYRRFHLYLWGSAHSFRSDILQCYRVVLEAPPAS